MVGPRAFAAAGVSTPAQPTSGTFPAQRTSVTEGSVSIDGNKIDYTATAGTIILKDVHNKPMGSMFYTAYVKRGVADESHRPVTFFYNGGPGSSSFWLHIGAWGPERVVVVNHGTTGGAPYKIVKNQYSLLDATDEVFIDAMSTGYSRIIRKEDGGVGTTKDFYGMDPDVAAFAQFITEYLTQENRWNSPKYLYGESYGVTRTELLVNFLEQRRGVNMNGIVLQSGGFRAGADTHVGLNYQLSLPTMAAVAWFHKKLPSQPADIMPFLQEVEHFALNEYGVALDAGNKLDPAAYTAIAEKLHEYTGLPLAYIERANLRVSLPQFRHELLIDQGETVGRLDGSYAIPTQDPLGETAVVDDMLAGIAGPYIAAFNYYVSNVLKYNPGIHFRGLSEVGALPYFKWNREHVNLVTHQLEQSPDALLDLEQAMRSNPKLKVLVSEGIFDAGYGGMTYAVNHLDIPKALQANVHEDLYTSGHMIYLDVPALKQLHDNTSRFIRDTENAQ